MLTVCGWVASGAGCSSSESGVNSPPDSATLDTRPLRLTIEFGDRREPVTGSIEYTENLSVLNLLMAVTSEKRIKVDFRGSGSTAFVTAIDEIRGGEAGNEYWVFLVNDKLANEGSGTLVVNPGDHVLWRMGKYPANAP